MQQNQPIVENKIALIKIAIDMHRRSYRVVRQIDHSAPQPAQKFEPPKFEEWLKKQIARAPRVVVCYEAGCFGYEPARRMQALGAEVLVIAPQDWDEQGKRQVNDQFDATVMCRRLSDYLCGHRKALAIVRIPTREEEARRAQGRLREQLCGQLRRMQAMGRSLLLLQEMVVGGRWWSAANWKRIAQRMPAWVVEQLESWKALLVVSEAQIAQVEAKLTAATPAAALFVGEGELSHQLIARELIDPHRFKNARQVGNFFGLCPSESSPSAPLRALSLSKRQRREPTAGRDHQARQPPLAPALDPTRLASGPLPARVSRDEALAERAGLGRAQAERRGAQESHRRAGAATGGGSVAHRHRAGPGRGPRTAPAAAAGQRRAGAA